jgi:NAD(P)-dependent dehydrogenase (short-subunit alcohol dehydrogenase family)
MKLPRTPSFSLSGRSALVTGAGRGIGVAAAAALAEVGANVLLTARTKSEIDEVRSAIEKAGGAARSQVLDVTNQDHVREVINSEGPFDVVVNNAGMNRPALALDVTEADYDEVMQLNVKATYFVAQAVTRSMIDSGIAGSIINVSSQLGHVGAQRRTVYSASKHAIEGFSRSLAWEVGKHGIRVNTLCPTFVETPMTRPMLSEPDFMEWVLSKIALGRVGQVEDVMGAVVYLASDASRLVTGSALLVDGGWTAN